MGICVDVIAPEGFPDVNEPIVSFARCQGNIMMAPQHLGLPRLDHCADDKERLETLRIVIADLDKGPKSSFDEEYWEAGDRQWSNGKEWRTLIRKWRDMDHYLPGDKTPLERAIEEKQEELRRHAMRFFLYFQAGYTVEWSP